MKIFRFFILATVILSVAGCTISGRMQRKQSGATLAYVAKKQRQEAVKDRQDDKIITGRNKIKSFYVPTFSYENGKRVMILQIPEVQVVAKSRTLTERNGKIKIDFIVTLPKELQGNCRSVAVTPILHNKDEATRLEDLTIRGGLFSRVQERNYWQYDRYSDVFNPDSAGLVRAYKRFIPYPYPEGVRLDSIIEHPDNISYHYTQVVKTDDLGKKIMITLKGNVVALDRSSYILPLSDTLNYNISSMISFVDTTTRYLTKIIEKYAVVRDRNYLNFLVNDVRIMDSLSDNARQLEHIGNLMNTLIGQKEFYVDSIILTASASPEGTVRKNDQLAKARAFSLRDHLVQTLSSSEINNLITVRWIGEDWNELISLIKGCNEMPNKDRILEMIARPGDRDALERNIRTLFPGDYKYMLTNFYPLLRAVSFKYDLRRVGMIKDTIHTTVPDTLYARGIELLQNRKYSAALYILDGYKDQNTAVTLLSLGYDDPASEVLSKLPKTAITEYLRAIACSRLGYMNEGLEHYNKACELDRSMEYRGGLDPEISVLLENINHKE